MHDDTVSQDPAVGFRAQLRGGDFLGAVRNLRDRIGPVKIHVRLSAERRSEMEALCRKRNLVYDERNRLSRAYPPADDEPALAQWNVKSSECQQKIENFDRLIEPLWRPSLHEVAYPELVSDVREALDYMPSNDLRFKNIASHIERLELWPAAPADATEGLNGGQSLYPGRGVNSEPLDATALIGKLDKLEYRLGEFLQPDQTRRLQIVDALQKKLGCNSRGALSRKLAIDESAIRAAIRGGLDHGGKAAASKIVLECQQSGVDAKGW